MSQNRVPAKDVFLNVRKAYRLLHDYQQMVIDAVRYISAQLDIEPNGGCARFAEDAKGGYRYLHTPSWDWLPMMCWEFHFVKPTGENQWLSLSIFIISDTGFFEEANEASNKADVCAFAQADQSSTRLAFMLRPTHFDNFAFLNSRSEMGSFVKEGMLPTGLMAQGFVGESHDMKCFLSEPDADEIVARILALAKEHSMPLEPRLKPSHA